MLTASPITRQINGRTFSLALAVLGVGALAQIIALCSVFAGRYQAAMRAATRPGYAPSPVLARLNTPPPFAENALDARASGSADLPSRPKPFLSSGAKTFEVPTTRFDELVMQGKLLRERGDTSTALTRFREAATINPKNPIAGAELAATFEKMGLSDKAGEQWRRIYDLGESAGIYYNLAEAKLKEAQAMTLRKLAGQPGSTADPEAPVEGVRAGATLGLLPPIVENADAPENAKSFDLRIPIKSRPGSQIDLGDVTIQVNLYDSLGGKNVVKTTADVSSHWVNPPADWTQDELEELIVGYRGARAGGTATLRENRKYFGYIVRIYYKGALQAALAQPDSLAEQFPAPATPLKDQ